MKEKPTFYSIKNWSEADRPREKLLKKGSSVLTDSELLAILLGSGSRSESAVSLAKRVLHSVDNSLNVLGKLSVENLKSFKGIGEAKAVTIAAALELGKRRRFQQTPDQERISSSSTAYQYFRPIIGELPHEEFWVLYLNNSNKILKPFQVSKGGITGTLVDVRIVLKQALELGAISIILAHNHPSGSLKPSNSDIKLTKKLKTACQSLDIKILDHLIVTEKAYFSFADESLL